MLLWHITLSNFYVTLICHSTMTYYNVTLLCNTVLSLWAILPYLFGQHCLIYSSIWAELPYLFGQNCHSYLSKTLAKLLYLFGMFSSSYNAKQNVWVTRIVSHRFWFTCLYSLGVVACFYWAVVNCQVYLFDLAF